MKNSIAIVLLLIVITGFSQTASFNLGNNLTPRVNTETLHRAKYINDISPFLWSSMSLPLNDDFWLYKRRINDYAQPQLENYLYPQDDYKQILEVVFTEISTTIHGKIVVAQATSDKLTVQQMEILNTVKLGAYIAIKLKYKYKDQTKDSYGPRNKTIEGKTQFMVVPETEAEYPGGFKQLSAYFANNVLNKITDKTLSDKIFDASIKFTITEEGQVVNAALDRKSGDARLDKLLLDTMNKMPRWKPAENSKGMKVQQTFIIPFSSGC